MKLVSWNVNGFRAVMSKGFEDVFKDFDADIFCIQESKMKEGQASFTPYGYHCFWSYAERAGYSGTAVFSRLAPKNVYYGINGKHNDEGRVITLEFDSFYFVCAYVPNAQDGLKRIGYRLEFEADMREYLSALDKVKPVIYTGDLNVAHEEIDIKNAKSNIGNAGFSYEERGAFSELLAAGFCDTFREMYPDTVKYSWWSYRFHARENNAGWRLDYFVVSERLMKNVKNAEIHNDVYGSDHCPVSLDIEL